jgi:hypothetical protein
MGANTQPQPVIVTPGISKLPIHKISVLKRKEPMPKVKTRNRCRYLRIKGQIRKIKNVDSTVKRSAEKKLFIVRPGVMYEIK